MHARIALGLLLLSPLTAPAADWPHWMGPTRNNVWAQDGILEKFPAGGPKVVWREPVTGGYAGPAVVGGKVYCSEYTTKTKLSEGNFERKEATGTEAVFCLDAATGKRLWEKSYPVTYTISYPGGPRCTPIVDNGKVYFLGAEGNLLCCDAAKGDIVWEKALKEVYKTKSALWGYAAHPLIDGQKLITLAGGDGSHVVALDKDTGKELWKSQTQSEQGYSPPSIITAGGQRQLLIAGPTAIRGLDPETGARLWSEKYDATSGSIIMIPVVVGEHLFLGGYLKKNLMLKLSADKPGAETLWKDKKDVAFCPLNVQPFVEKGVVYGYDSEGTFYAMEMPSGKRLWSGTGPVGTETPKGSETAFIVKNGDRFLFFTEKGEIVLGKLTPEKYEEIDRAKVLEPTSTAFGRKVVWCMPAFAGTQMFVRNDKEMICVELKK